MRFDCNTHSLQCFVRTDSSCTLCTHTPALFLFFCKYHWSIFQGPVQTKLLCGHGPGKCCMANVHVRLAQVRVAIFLSRKFMSHPLQNGFLTGAPQIIFSFSLTLTKFHVFLSCFSKVNPFIASSLLFFIHILVPTR